MMTIILICLAIVKVVIYLSKGSRNTHIIDTEDEPSMHDSHHTLVHGAAELPLGRVVDISQECEAGERIDVEETHAQESNP